MLFTRLVARLIDRAIAMGYQATLGEVLRGKAQAQANAASGAGISNSLHLDGLAVDLNLYLNGRWLQNSEDHADLGRWWKAQHPDCRWGGDFKDSKGRPKPDGNHYSITFQGRA
jgi:hypothetical protein